MSGFYLILLALCYKPSVRNQRSRWKPAGDPLEPSVGASVTAGKEKAKQNKTK